MTLPVEQTGSADPEVRDPVDPAVVQEVAAWVGLLARTLKSSRLYDAANPTVVRFREELSGSLLALLSRRGPVRLVVSSNTLSYGSQPVHVGRSRDDNLAAVFHRDGIRSLTFEPGIEPRELEALLEQILQVTGPAAADDDLVTLLWDANLVHVSLETVPLEGEADGGTEDDGERPAVLTWPRQDRSAAPPVGSADAEQSRSDDWTAADRLADLDRAFDELESAALFEIARFQQEHEASEAGDPVAESLRILQDCLASPLTEADRKELAEFVPRVVREALAIGDWRATSTAVRLLRQCDPEWSVEAFARNLCGPHAITTGRVVTALDQQDAEGVDGFLALARELGSALAEWLMHVLAESERMQVRRPLARTIAELLPNRPEPVVPWLADARWYVVRNAVHILGWIGGDAIAASLHVVSEHSEPRVRREVVAALNQTSKEASRPILLEMLKTAESQLFGTILHQLALDPHPSIAQRLLQLLEDDSFHRRSDEERHALFLALATRGDEVLPTLEAALNEGGLFSRRAEPDRTGIALCIARIGTPAAKAILAAGLASKRAVVRKACTIAGASEETSDG
jgi:HEAT repeat protein